MTAPDRPGPDHPDDVPGRAQLLAQWDTEPSDPERDVELDEAGDPLRPDLAVLERPWCTDCGQPLTPDPDQQTTGLCLVCRWGAGL